jgi:hypothetical protein
MTPRLTRFALAASISAVLIATAGPSSVAHRYLPQRDLDLTASAQPASAGSTVSDRAFDNGWTRGRHVKADTTAISTATCDGCDGAAQALQILYVSHARDGVVLDNAAVAWSQCRDCRASALSVQVVVVRKGRSLTANNRASAANVACEGCTTAAAAYQLVVAGGGNRALSGRAVRELRAWVEEQAEALRGAPMAALRGGPVPETTKDDTSALESLVNADLGSATLSLEADVDRP